MAPGPRVAEHTPARPVRRPKISAMNDAACSWRTKMYRIEDRERASVRWIFSSPGMPNTHVTPSVLQAAARSGRRLVVGPRPPKQDIWKALQPGNACGDALGGECTVAAE